MIDPELLPEIDLENLKGLLGQQAIGFTVLNERSLVVDYAGGMLFDRAPLDPEFLRHVRPMSPSLPTLTVWLTTSAWSSICWSAPTIC